MEQLIFGVFMKTDLFQTIKMTETKNNIFKKIQDFQKKNIVIKRNANWFNYKYSSYDYIWENIHESLDELQIVVHHSIQDYGGILYLETIIVDMESWESRSSVLPINSNLDPQKLGSAITYYKRYNLGALLNLIIEGEDDDGALATKKQAPQQKATTTAKKPAFTDEAFGKFKSWTKEKTAEDIIKKKEEILNKYYVSDKMKSELENFLSTL